MNIKFFSHCLLTLPFLLLGSCDKDEPADKMDYFRLERTVDEFQEKYKPASISIGLVAGEVLSWQYQTGLSNKEDKVAIQKETIYKLGSVSKPFTGLLLMKLVEQGKINLDQDINTYLPFNVLNPYFPATKITVRQIMTHTSGITDKVYNERLLTDFVNMGNDHPMPLRTFVREMLTIGGQYYSKESFAINKPGSMYGYSNVAVALAGCIIEEVSGQSFEDFSKQYITIPLKMEKTFWRISQIPSGQLAYPYGPQGENYGSYGLVDLPSGGLHGTIGNMSRFMGLLMNKGSFGGHQLFKPESIEEVERLQFPTSVDPDLKNQGLLLEHTQIGRYHLIGHNGKVPGSNAFMWMDTKARRGVVVMVNGEFTSQNMMDDLMRLLETALGSR